MAILRKKQDQLNVRLPDEIINFLALHIRSHIRCLENALIRVVAYSSLTGKPATIETLNYVLRDTLEHE